MFGPDLLVAPVFYEGARSREVYLPAGTTWKDAWSDGHYRCPAEAPAALSERGKDTAD